MKRIDERVRYELSMGGLPDEFRAQENALAYASMYMSEAEYKEMYDNGSDVYKAAADKMVAALKKVAI